MANPQREKGHIQIATELFEALCKIRISGEARQVLDTIIRKTYGFNKKEDAIALSQFEKQTGMSKTAICKAILKLEEMNLITKNPNAVANIYRFNKDFETWKPLPKKEKVKPLPKKEIAVTKNPNNDYPKGDIQKTVTIDTITKDNTSDLPIALEGDPVNVIFNLLHQINPALNYGNITQRKAAEWLIEKLGKDKAFKFTQYAISIQGEKFAPTALTPMQLKEKSSAIALYKVKQGNKESKGVRI